MSRRPDPPARPSREPSPSGELQLSTLVIAAAASAAAAFVTSQVWPAGALWSAAVSPIIVALVKEALNKPAQALQTVRLPRTGATSESAELPQDTASPVPPATGEGPVTVYGRRGSGHHWRIAVLTGLLAFVIVVALFTLPELISGNSIGQGGGQRTTLFGGKPTKRAANRDAQETPTPTPGATPTATPTATPSAVPTPTATPTPTPTVSVEPNTAPTAAATTPPAQATAAPTPTPTP